MEKTTQKELKRLVEFGHAIDITRYDFEKVNALREKEKWLDCEMVSSGVYGLNGAYLIGHNTKQAYVITARTGALSQLV